MSTLDLTEAGPVVAVLLVQYAQAVVADDGLFDTDRTGEFVDKIVAATAPLIARQVADSIAARDEWSREPDARMDKGWAVAVIDRAIASALGVQS